MGREVAPISPDLEALPGVTMPAIADADLRVGAADRTGEVVSFAATVMPSTIRRSQTESSHRAGDCSRLQRLILDQKETVATAAYVHEDPIDPTRARIERRDLTRTSFVGTR